MTDTQDAPPVADPGPGIPGTLTKLAVPVAGLTHYGKNPRRGDVDLIESSLRRHGQYRPIVVRAGTGEVLAGNHTLTAARDRLGWTEIAATFVDVDDDQAARIVLMDNAAADAAGYDNADLVALLEELAATSAGLDGTGFDTAALAALQAEISGLSAGQSPNAGILREKYGVPPFSVLDGRAGPWRDRKAAWLALGIRSEAGRLGGLVFQGDERKDPAFYAKKRAAEHTAGRDLTRAEFVADHYDASLQPSSTSVFDPVLCELMYRWFSPPDGMVMDPFAGGSVRGIVAAVLGRDYVGVDLSGAQVAENRVQAGAILDGIDTTDLTPSQRCGAATWTEGDSRDLDRLVPGSVQADLLFSCPPYADLERYSDDPADLSTMSYEEFRKAHVQVVAAACARLRPDRFAVWVVGEARNRRHPSGAYYGLIPDTIAAFVGAGLDYYGEAVMIEPVGSLRLTVARSFESSRKLGKCHQHVLIFVKGDARAAAVACGVVDLTDVAPDLADEGI